VNENPPQINAAIPAMIKIIPAIFIVGSRLFLGSVLGFHTDKEISGGVISNFPYTSYL
jgi:hypothetical protein